MKKLKVFECFAGIGSQAMALRNIGTPYEVVGISEIDKNALLGYDAIHCDQSYKPASVTIEEMKDILTSAGIGYNSKSKKCILPQNNMELERLYMAHIRTRNFGDISKVVLETLPDIDLFTYSFPCTNISICGKQAGLKKGSGTASSLVWDCERLIRSKKPKYLMMENVKNICGKTHRGEFDEWIQTLESLGYTNKWEILNAKHFCLPQNRERVIMLSILGEEEILFPPHKPNTRTIVDILDTQTTHTYLEPYVGEMPMKNPQKIHKIEIIPKVTVRKYEVDVPKLQACLKSHKHLNTLQIATALGKSETLVAHWFRADKYFAIPTPDVWPNLKRLLHIETMEFDKSIMEFIVRDGVYDQAARCYFETGIAPTLTASSCNEKIITSKGIRKLTSLECWRLQGYTDDDYYKAKEIGQLSEQSLCNRAGNGIAVPMLEELFKVFLP